MCVFLCFQEERFYDCNDLSDDDQDVSDLTLLFKVIVHVRMCVCVCVCACGEGEGVILF